MSEVNGVKKTKKEFFDDAPGNAGTEFRSGNYPSEQEFRNFFENSAFKSEEGDRARLDNASPDIFLKSGLVVLATDGQAKSNAAQQTDRSLVVQPSQLPTVEPSMFDNADNDVDGSPDDPLDANTKTDLLNVGFDLENDVTISNLIDPSVTTRNKIFSRFSNKFLNWIKDIVNAFLGLQSDVQAIEDDLFSPFDNQVVSTVISPPEFSIQSADYQTKTVGNTVFISGVIVLDCLANFLGVGNGTITINPVSTLLGVSIAPAVVFDLGLADVDFIANGTLSTSLVGDLIFQFRGTFVAGHQYQINFSGFYEV